MARNVEIKARAGAAGRQERLAAELADSGPEVLLQQEDTFFVCANGRLKLREFGDGTGELIFYERPDAAGPKGCEYVIVRTADAAALKAALSAALGVAGVVRKTRRVYLCGQTRIHLDDVEGLGRFIELEVVLEDGDTEERGGEIACDLMAKLGIEEADLVEGAYVDLMSRP